MPRGVLWRSRTLSWPSSPARSVARRTRWPLTRRSLAAREEASWRACVAGADAQDKADVALSVASIAWVLEDTVKTDEALATYRRAESLLAGLAGSDPAARPSLAECRRRIGRLLTNKGEYAEAMAALKLARVDQNALAAVPEASKAARRELAITIDELGIVLRDTGKYSESEAENRAAIAIFQKLVDEDPNDTESRKRLGNSHVHLGRVLRNRSDAVAKLGKAREIYQKLVDENPGVRTFRRNLGVAHRAIGDTMLALNEWAESEAELKAARAIFQELTDDDPSDTDYLANLAGTHSSLGVVLSRTGKPSAAVAEYRRAMVIYQKRATEKPRRDLPSGRPGETPQCRRRRPDKDGQAIGGSCRVPQGDGNLPKAGRRKPRPDRPSDQNRRNSPNTVGGMLTEMCKSSEAVAEYCQSLATAAQKVSDSKPTLPWHQRQLASSSPYDRQWAPVFEQLGRRR